MGHVTNMGWTPGCSIQLTEASARVPFAGSDLVGLSSLVFQMRTVPSDDPVMRRGLPSGDAIQSSVLMGAPGLVSVAIRRVEVSVDGAGAVVRRGEAERAWRMAQAWADEDVMRGLPR